MSKCCLNIICTVHKETHKHTQKSLLCNSTWINLRQLLSVAHKQGKRGSNIRVNTPSPAAIWIVILLPSTAAPLLGLSSDKQRRHVSPVSGESSHILSEDTIQTFRKSWNERRPLKGVTSNQCFSKCTEHMWTGFDVFSFNTLIFLVFHYFSY